MTTSPARRPPAPRPPARTRKPRGQGHERVEEILDAAKALYGEGGHAAATTRRIAARVGVSQTALYTHFPDRDAILEAVCERAFRDLDDRLLAAESAAPSRAGVFRAVLRAYLDFALSVPVEYDLMFMSHRQAPVRLPAVGLHAFERFRGQVAALIAEGHLRQGDPGTVAQTIWSALHGLAALQIARPGFPWADRGVLVDTLVDGLARGFAADPGDP
ncbi:TetR/AcrR family transcriptional regulator [Thalassobaculum sp.]|uniref:TetR/AcrR family transcriptional regulator n=1 Tax=Thalassobaculum sp. TaxID=2022740 RepID=UPI0032EAAF86